MAGDEHARLERIEAKIDQLSLAVVTLARLEERIVTLFDRTREVRIFEKDITQRVEMLERAGIGRNLFFRAVDKLAWLIIGAIVAASFAYFTGRFRG